MTVHATRSTYTNTQDVQQEAQLSQRNRAMFYVTFRNVLKAIYEYKATKSSTRSRSRYKSRYWDKVRPTTKDNYHLFMYESLINQCGIIIMQKIKA